MTPLLHTEGNGKVYIFMRKHVAETNAASPRFACTKRAQIHKTAFKFHKNLATAAKYEMQ